MASPRPQLFDVMPASELQRALRQTLPAGTTVVWHSLGQIAITAGKIGAVDAASLHPKYPSEIYQLDWPHPRAEIWLQLALGPDRKVERVFALLVSLPGTHLTAQHGGWEMVEGPSMAIDSASAAIGDYGRMLSEMRGGGPQSQTCLGRGGSVKDPAAKQARERAAALLVQHGYPAKVERYDRTDSLSVGFQPGLTDEQIAAANALLAQAGFADEVWLAGSHTSGQLADALLKTAVTHLADQHGAYLIACKTGFGDGTYYWDGLVRAGQLCGYLCNFVPAEAESNSADEAEILEAEVAERTPLPPARPGPPRSQAPAIVPGVIVAVRLPYDQFGIARVEQRSASGWGVLYVTGNRAHLTDDQVIPIPGQPVFQVGDEVLALWDGGVMYQGRVTAVSSAGYTVAWTDGSPPQVVALGTLTYWSWV